MLYRIIFHSRTAPKAYEAEIEESGKVFGIYTRVREGGSSNLKTKVARLEKFPLVESGGKQS